MPTSGPPPFAAMGFYGFVFFDVGAFDAGYATQKFVRATSCDIKMTQNIEKPAVIDGRFDRTVYQLGPKEVGGSVAFPAIYEDGAALVKGLWNAAVKRNDQGRLPTSRVQVYYARGSNGARFTYTDVIADTFEFTVAQSDLCNCTVGVIGIDRTEGTAQTESNFTNPNTRAVTWNDAIVEATVGGIANVTRNSVRQFSCNVNNNSQRFYTLNGYLSPQDVAPTKRDITGSMTLMGRISDIGARGFTNESRCSEDSTIRFGYATTLANCSGKFVVVLTGVVFQIEELALTNELFETTVNWHCLPNDNASNFLEA